jgi:hypothetical protein
MMAVKHQRYRKLAVAVIGGGPLEGNYFPGI